MKLIYIVERFPTFSETFINDEIADHLANGLDVEIAVLSGPGEADYPITRCGQTIQDRATYLGIGKSKAQLLKSGFASAWKAGHTSRLAGAWQLSVREIMIGSVIAERYPYEAILHCHFGNIGRIGLAVQKLSRKPKRLFVTFHAHEMVRSWFLPLQDYYAPLFQSDATLLPISDYWRKVLVEAGANPQRTLTHRLGTELIDRLSEAPTSEEFVKLVMVGRLVKKKGHETAIEAIRLVRDGGIALRCDIIGGGPCEGEIRQLLDRYDLHGTVMLHGSLEHSKTLKYLEGADIFLLPSETAPDGDMEGIPVSLMEAMARKIPVISTYHSGIPELIETGVSGLLAPERQPQQLAEAIEALASDSLLRLQLAEAGRERVQERFNAPIQAARLREIYATA